MGDFTTLLLSINPTLLTNEYPEAWTQYTVTISGLPAPTSGRIAFRYFVTNGGSAGDNSNYIGIDNVVYTPTDDGGSASSTNLWIKKLSAKVNDNAPNTDSWTAQYLYNADRRSGHVFNPATDALDLALADSSIHLPAGSLTAKGSGFVYRSAKGVSPVVKVSLAPSTQTLTASVSGTELGALTLPATVQQNTLQLGSEQGQLKLALNNKGKFTPTVAYESAAMVVASATVKDVGTVKDSLTLSVNLADPALLSVYDFDAPCPAGNKNCKQPAVSLTLYDENDDELLTKDLTALLATTRSISGNTAFYTMKKIVKKDPDTDNVLSALSFASKKGVLKLALKNLMLANPLDAGQAQLGVAINIDGKRYFTRVTLFETADGSQNWNSKYSKFATPSL